MVRHVQQVLEALVVRRPELVEAVLGEHERVDGDAEQRREHDGDGQHLRDREGELGLHRELRGGGGVDRDEDARDAGGRAPEQRAAKRQQQRDHDEAALEERRARVRAEHRVREPRGGPRDWCWGGCLGGY